MDTTSTSTSRRRVVQGIAWAAPAVAMTAAAPAFAISKKCTPTVRFSGGTAVDWGNQDETYSKQQIAFGGQVYVDNLPPGVTVTSVTEHWFIENAQGQDSTGNGYWFMGNNQTNWYKSAKCTNVGCSVQWTGPLGVATSADYTTAPGKGWSTTVKNTFNDQSTLFSDGVWRNAWDVTTTWNTSPSNTGITPGTSGCNNFTTGPSGKFGVNYLGVDSKTKKDPGVARKAAGTSVSIFTDVTIYLSAGGPLTYKTATSTIKSYTVFPR